MSSPQANPEAASATRSPGAAGKLVNFAVFQAVWFACVYGAAKGTPWAGPAAAALLLPINLWFSPSPRTELRLWALAGLIGLVLDTGLRTAGWVGFPAAQPTTASVLLAPVWIVTLWVAFGSLLNSSLGWLTGRARLTVLLSAIGGPFSFWSGTRIGATSVPVGWMGYLALSIEYAVVVPLLMHASRTMFGRASLEVLQGSGGITPRHDRAEDPAVTGTNEHDPRR